MTGRTPTKGAGGLLIARGKLPGKRAAPSIPGKGATRLTQRGMWGRMLGGLAKTTPKGKVLDSLGKNVVIGHFDGGAIHVVTDAQTNMLVRGYLSQMTEVHIISENAYTRCFPLNVYSNNMIGVEGIGIANEVAFDH